MPGVAPTLINTSLQRGVADDERFETVSTVSVLRKTVETVLSSVAAPDTPLKRGVNESTVVTAEHPVKNSG